MHAVSHIRSIPLAVLGLVTCMAALQCPAQTTPPADIKTLKAKYEQGLAAIQDESNKALTNSIQGYADALKTLKQKLQGVGDLDGILATKKEAERFGKEKALPESAVVADCVALRDLQHKWQKTHDAIDVSKSKKVVTLSKSHIAALEEVKKLLTMQGKVEEAVVVKDEIERVRTSAEVTAAEFVLANAGIDLAANTNAAVKIVAPRSIDPIANLRGSLALYYSFDKDEGGKVTDKSGKGHDGKVRGAEYTSSGKRGGAYSFSGRNSIIYSANHMTVSRGSDYTICTWFKKSGGGTMGIVRIGTETGGRDQNVLELSLTVMESSHLVARVDECQVDARLTPGFSVEDDVWYHATLVYSKAKVSLYVNGKSAGSVMNDLRGGIPGKEGITRIGSDWTYVSECPFSGLIDEVMIFNHALSDDEIASIYDAQK
jgi:Concanavalin A-like lectin/glucanases superfamily